MKFCSVCFIPCSVLTAVFVSDTVERNILDLAARRGLSLYTKGNSAGTLNVSSFDVAAGDKDIDSPSKKKHALKGDFISKYGPS